MIATIDEPYVPPIPEMGADNQNGLQLLRAMRRNTFNAFPQSCLREPLVCFSALSRTLVMTATPDPIRHVLHTHSDDYGHLEVRRRILGPIVGRGLVNSEGQEWHAKRRALAPAFTPRSIPTFARHVMKHTEEVCARFASYGPTPFDLQRELSFLGLEIAAISMFSLEVGRLGKDLRNMLAFYADVLGKPSATDYILPRGIPTVVGIRRAAFRRRWTKLIQSFVAQRRSMGTPDHARDLFDLLSGAHDGKADDLLIDEVSTMLVAGHETTALTIFWMLFLLAQAPAWQAAIAEEAKRVDLSPENCAAALDELPISQAVFQETLRLYSPSFMSARLAKRTHSVCGVDVPKGAIVFMPFWLLHRHPAFWGSPHAFDPSRFLNGRKPARFTFLPFGAGPRTCIGAQLATAEAILVVARLVRQFVVTVADDRPVSPVAVIATRPDRTIPFIFRRRM